MTKQLLHLVLGGELTHLDSHDFKDVSNLDIVGIFPNYAETHRAWTPAAQRTVADRSPPTRQVPATTLQLQHRRTHIIRGIHSLYSSRH